MEWLWNRRAVRRAGVLVTVALAVASAPGPAQAAPTAPPPSPSPPAAAAAGPDRSTLSWSVRPTPTASAPDRPNYSYDATPGKTVKDSIRIRNYDRTPLALDLYASDALTTSSGALDLLPAGRKPVDVGAWIKLDKGHVVVPANKFLDVPFTMTVPAGVEPGDHTGGIVTSYKQAGKSATGAPVVLDRRLGSRVQVRVAGALHPALVVSDLSVGYSGTVNPIGPGSLQVHYTVRNTGNVRLAADQTVTASIPFATVQTVTPRPVPELLPGSSLSFTVDLPGVWPAFLGTARVELRLKPTRPGDSFPPDTSASGSHSVLTMPWPQLVVLLLLVGLVLGWRWSRVRRRRREATLVDTAVKNALANQANAEAPSEAPADGADHDRTALPRS
jgi:hypothetical protein